VSRFPNLQHTIIAALASAGIACTCPDGEVEREYTVKTTGDAAYAELVTRCLEDDLSCADLCMALLSPEEREYDMPSVIECRLDLNTGNNQARVQATYVFPADCVGGRRPSGQVSCTQPVADPVSHWIATMTTLEASAVYAFVQLARDLLAHGAPRSLAQRCLVAADDEVRHTATMRDLARSRGIDPMLPQWTPEESGSLLDLAVQNACEGCVRETYGAALAMWQSQHCSDPDLAAALEEIARDEMRHAQLSADIDRWFRETLSPSELRIVARARRIAIEELLAATSESKRDLRLGVPSSEEAHRIVCALFA
jgi:hypothetical protein